MEREGPKRALVLAHLHWAEHVVGVEAHSDGQRRVADERERDRGVGIRSQHRRDRDDEGEGDEQRGDADHRMGSPVSASGGWAAGWHVPVQPISRVSSASWMSGT